MYIVYWTIDMASAEEQYRQLHVYKHLDVMDLVVHGNLDVNLSQLHAHSVGEFVSSNVDPALYVHIDDQGNYVEFGEIDTDSNKHVQLQKHITLPNSKYSILFSDMHYDHHLSPTLYYRFTSDRDVLLLYQVQPDSGLLHCYPMFEQNSRETVLERDLFVMDVEEHGTEVSPEDFFV